MVSVNILQFVAVNRITGSGLLLREIRIICETVAHEADKIPIYFSWKELSFILF